MTVNPIDGPLCICGNRGCFEAMVSAKRIREMIREACGRGVKSGLFRDKTPETATLDDVCEMANAGDPFCLSIIEDVARWFIVGLGNIIMVNDPELIVIQGQYVKAGRSSWKSFGKASSPSVSPTWKRRQGSFTQPWEKSAASWEALLSSSRISSQGASSFDPLG